jgi:amino acid adenylation domain-containing protein
MSTLEERLAALSPERRALVFEKMRGKSAPAPSPRGVERAPAEERSLLSFAQRRLWFLSQFDSTSEAYHLAFALRMTGELDMHALQQSLTAIVERHEVLRTIFRSGADGPKAHILPLSPVNVAVIDLRALTQAHQAEEIRSRIDRERQKRFDLANGPLLRFALFELEKTERVLCVVMHHIVSDAWSLGVFVRELEAFYSGYTSGRAAGGLAELPIQYADYARWQRKWLDGGVLDTQLGYWKRQLAGNLPVLELPTRRPRPPVQTFRGGATYFNLDSAQTCKLRVLGERYGATLFMTLLAAFVTLLHRYTGQRDLVVGSPIANRNRVEIEPLIGFFVNTLVLRSDLSGDPSFEEILRRTREVALGAYTHQDVPFETLVEVLAPERSLTHAPLVQVMFMLQNVAIRELELPGLVCTPIELETLTAKFDLTLAFEEDLYCGAKAGAFAYSAKSELRGRFEYNSDLFEAGTIERMATHFRRLLEGVVADPGRKVSRIALLGEAEREQIVIEWNRTERNFPTERTICSLFEERARREPEAVALVSGDEAVSYRQLDARANALAHWLREQGVGVEALVGIPTERSVRLIVAMLGILKAGGAYVPLDLEQPAPRLERIRRNCTLVLTLDEITGAECDFAPLEKATAENLAYVMYTSGSTGDPKGVAVPHRAVNRLVVNTDYCQLTAEDVVAQAATAAFDAATFEIWGPLLNGARFVITPRETILSAPAFKEHCIKHGIGALFVTTVLFNQLAYSEESVFTVLKHLLFGGEAVDPLAVRRALERGRPGRLLHVYGPTEVTTFSTWQEVHGVEGGCVPIGGPIANTTLYILDERMEPVPMGVAGELYLGGPGLARGYYGMPELTAAKFVPDPFSNWVGARLYRSGDLGRYRPDGAVEFLGRIDYQVKVRGYRVEPAEIESVLVSHPAVGKAVVTVAVSEEESSSKRLVGYVVAEKGREINLRELRSYAATKLPEYMVPALLVELDALPLNANGKIDRNALPEPDLTKLQAEYVAPRNPIEQRLASIWTDVLGIKNPGIHDNFFALGGHSLLATQLVNRVRDAFGADLPLRRLFEFPTLGGLAERVADICSGIRPPAPEIFPVPRDRELPLSFAQERLWFLNQLEPENPFYNMPTILRLSGPFDVAAVQRVINEIVRRHEVLRTRFVSTNGKPVQIIEPSLSVELPLIDLRSKMDRNATAERLIVEEARRAFDLANGPLLRSLVLRLDVEEHILLLTMHHIISDGWSMGVLTEEMAVLYNAFSQAQQSPLPDLPVQYADFACWQRCWLSGEVLERQLAYWKEKLGDAPPMLSVPTDRPRPAVQSYRGSSLHFEIDSAMTAGLRRLSERCGATMFMTLHAAFAVLLSRYSGQDDVVIGSPIANRTRAEMEPMIGFFVNTLALRTDLTGDTSFVELVSRVRQCCLDAYAHQDLPFERLVDELQPERDLSRNPVFQVMFALQNAPMEHHEVSALKLEVLSRRRISAQFDLVLDIWEIGEELQAVLEYNTDLFDLSSVERMAGHFKTLLAGINANPEQQISTLPLLTAPERRQLLVEFNDTACEYPRHKCLHELFGEQAAASPERTCLVHNGRSFTYRELNESANRIANLLRRVGVCRDSFVGILDERGPDFLTAMLGTLKAGGAFVSLDPSYPPDRIRYMVVDSQLGVLVTRWSSWEKFGIDIQSDHLRSVICFGERNVTNPPGFGKIRFFDAADLQAEESFSPASINESSDLTYMLYTSGSTGTPKGAMVRHDGAVNHIFAEFKELQFHRDTAFLQSAPSTSDISVWQFLAATLIGGRTVIAEFETVCDPEKLFSLIKAERITLIEFVPVVLKALLDYASTLQRAERALPALEWAMVTGETVPVSLANQWISLYPGVKLVNAYGPTEAADDICQFVLSAPLPVDTLSVPIGKPLANLTLYVLDRNLNLLPVGVPGEICVAGVGVGAGYWRAEEKTRESFVPNPYDLGGRAPMIYRTGDLGRWLPDGNLEMLGRIDQQVKLRGFRIELGEIESIVAQHPGVREAAVLVREDRPGDRRLVAYVTGKANSALRIDGLQEEQVSLWRDLHDGSYAETLDYGDPTFDVIGWDSNYTGKPLPRSEMEEYVDYTVERVLALNPRNVLEIGCGTGLLLFRIAPHCQRYVGTDLSSVAINRLKQVTRRLGKFEHVDLRTVRADEIDTIEGAERGSFDTVMLCSVVQYFPGIDYLFNVLQAAVRMVRPGGAIFLGDIRSLPLLKAFHASVQLFKAPDNLPLSRLRRRVRQQYVREPEMAVDPAFFATLRKRLPQVTHVWTEPKRGFLHNEMTRFRYDVTLYVGGEIDVVNGVSWEEWDSERFSLEALPTHLRSAKPDILGLRSVCNSRVEKEIAALELIAQAPESETVRALRERLAARASRGIDPEELLRIGAESPYDVRICCALGRADGSFDVVFKRRDAEADRAGSRWFPAFSSKLDSTPALAGYANNPIQEKLARELVPQVRSFLKEKLPSYMVPYEVIALESFPLLPNGKIDRHSLPAPEVVEAGLDGSLVPNTVVEKVIAGIWEDVLGVQKVGIRDNFFELGGHSLKATQVVSRIQKQLGIEVPLRDLFRMPTIEELAKQIEAWTPSGSVAIARVPDASDYPMSNAQRRLWVLSQTEASSVAYNMPAAVILEGFLDHELFTRTFNTLVARHESLRTAFTTNERGEPRQKVLPVVDSRIRTFDFSESSDPEAAAREFAEMEAMRPFDLEHGPLVRLSLLKLGKERCVLFFNMHHIISDDWSIGVLVREFVRVYHSLRHGQNPGLPELKIQYRDYAAWQNLQLESDTAAVHRRYWLNKLAGEIPVINLPLDFPRSPVKTYRGKTLALKLSRTQRDQLLMVGTDSGATLFMTLVAVVKVLLHRYTGENDILVGFPIAGRNHSDLENQIGFYVNALPLRDEVNGEMSFFRVLEKVRETTIGAYEHQAYPFDRLVDELSLRRDVSHSPLFDVLVIEQNVDPYELMLDGLQVKAFNVDFAVSKFDLSFYFSSTPQGLDVAIVYNPDLFLESRIERMGRHFRELVASILDDSFQPIGRLNLLPKAERELLLYDFNPAPVQLSSGEISSGETLVGRFEAQASRRPDAVAVTFETRCISYAELNEKADRLARYLWSLGIGANKPVAVYLERSIDLIVGLLGILKAGGAYVPLDPIYPRERLALVIDDAQVSVVLTQEAIAGNLPEHGAQIVLLDAHWAMIASIHEEISLPEVHPENTAYIIYTSGSTGKPKGVIVSHNNVVRLFSRTEDWFRFRESDVWTLFHSYAFDFSVWEIWGALLHGGRLVVVPHEISRSPDAFHELLRVEGVTVLNQTPSAFRNLIQADRALDSTALRLRTVIFGGEALDLSSLRRWFERHGDKSPQLVNMYGITETTVHVTYRPLTAADLDNSHSVIGSPIPDLQVYLLDQYLQPVPKGIAGEICVGGAGLAAGYLGRADLTAERFVPDPFGVHAGARLYRSGDLGRYLPDGDIDYLGRTDHQVKIRGFRIELGEIEAALVSHPQVGEGLVILSEHSSSEKWLVAYCVLKSGEICAGSQIRDFLKAKLPEYMIPARVVILPAFPLTANGKIDRRSLPEPDQLSPAVRVGGRTEPLTAIEQAIADIWQELLHLDAVGPEENFFDLGGDSLLIIQAHGRIRAKLACEISVLDMFRYPTIRSLAQNLSGSKKEFQPEFERTENMAKRQREARQRRRHGK